MSFNKRETLDPRSGTAVSKPGCNTSPQSPLDCYLGCGIYEETSCPTCRARHWPNSGQTHEPEGNH